MKLYILFLNIAGLLLIVSGCSKKEQESLPMVKTKTAVYQPSVKVELPTKYANLLKQEMLKIDAAMKQLITLISQGKTQETVVISEQIYNNFILKQSLSKDELKELVGILPRDFVQLDRTFHGNAKRLAEAARKSDFNKSVKIYNEMFNGCISCHSRFAPDKFPGLSNQ